MPITREDVLKAAELARLAVTDSEIELYTKQLQRILNHVEKLSGLSTVGIEPTFFSVAKSGFTLREDSQEASAPREGALQNAPQSERGCFKVPKIIE